VVMRSIRQTAALFYLTKLDAISLSIEVQNCWGSYE
jgi:hypothetical protein